MTEEMKYIVSVMHYETGVPNKYLAACVKMDIIFSS